MRPQDPAARVPAGAAAGLAGTHPVQAAAAQGLAGGYGLTAGATYALLRPRARGTMVDGVAFGLATWAVGYAGWLPALHLLPTLSRQPVAAALGPAVRHVIFGLVTVAVYRRLTRAPAGQPGSRWWER